LDRLRTAMSTTLAMCALAAAGPAQASSSETPLRMLAAVNHVRSDHGLPPLRDAPVLRRSASAYARWMLRADYFGHQSRIQASPRFTMLGENLAWHSGRRPLVRFTVRQWMNSPPHRAIMLHRGFRWLGAGMARGRYSGTPATMWVLHLGRR
jgi:uncharacterized protein YkwD